MIEIHFRYAWQKNMLMSIHVELERSGIQRKLEGEIHRYDFAELEKKLVDKWSNIYILI
jgi:hypothetical protein